MKSLLDKTLKETLLVDSSGKHLFNYPFKIFFGFWNIIIIVLLSEYLKGERVNVAQIQPSIAKYILYKF